MKSKKYHTVGIIPKSKRNIDSPNTCIHDSTSAGLGTATSISRGGVKLILLCSNPTLTQQKICCHASVVHYCI